MDVTPMSMQVMLPHSTEVSQIQHHMNQAGAVQQDFETLRQKMDADLKQKQVREKEAAEEGRIKDDPEHRNRGGYGGSGQRKGNGEEQSVEDQLLQQLAMDPSRGRNIDISF